MNILTIVKKLLNDSTTHESKSVKIIEAKINHNDQLLKIINQYREDSKILREAINQEMVSNPDFVIKQQKADALKKINEAKYFVKQSGLDQSLLNIFLKIRYKPTALYEIDATDIIETQKNIKIIKFIYNLKAFTFELGNREISGSGVFDDGYNYGFKVFINENEVFNITFNEETKEFGDSEWTFFEPYLFINGMWVEDIIEIDEKFKIMETKKSVEYQTKIDLHKIKEAERFVL
ncbi:hypothetical protein EOM39_06990 [Candidatus Gracilibacteria bacterium]|nr:hypothetical protein [Candidatus Gracilibacteria bacterium]